MAEESLGTALRRLRSAADLTLEALAERSGVSSRTISDIERGVSVGPQHRTIELVADALGLAPADRAAVLGAARAGRRRDPSAAATRTARAVAPRGVADFTGRRTELGVLTAHLVRSAPTGPGSVAVVSGPPGFGKSSLAVRVAADCAEAFDETYFVDLRGYGARPVDALTLVDRLVHAVDPAAGAVPRRLDDAALVWQDLVAGRRVLVVLDDAATEDQVRAALPAVGPAAVVVTTRGALAGLEDVVRVSLAPLGTDESVALLGTIVPAPQAQGQDLRRLAALCDHVPLALRIAGNRLASRPAWTVDDLAARLAAEDRRIDGLRAGDLEIRAAFALSYDRLSPRGRRAFRRLALLRGTTFGDAVAARLVPADLGSAEEALDELVGLGLVQPAAGGGYRLHDLLRLFARGRLVAEESEARRAQVEEDLRRWLLDVTIAAGRWFEPGFERPPDAPDPLVDLSTPALAQVWLREESEHWLIALEEAFEAGEHRLVVDVAESLHWFSDLWVHAGCWHDVYSWGVASARALGDDVELATQLGYLAWAESTTRGEPEAGLARAIEAADVARRAGDVRQEGWAECYVGLSYRLLDRFAEGLDRFDRAVPLLEAADDVEGTLQAMRGRAICLRWLDRPEESIAQEREVLALLDAPTTVVSPQVAGFTRAAGLSSVSRTLGILERWEESAAVASEALALLEVREVASLLVAVLTNRFRAATALGRHDVAGQDRDRLVELHVAAGDAAAADEVRGW